MRLADEIQYFPFSIFFTLTYSNKYLPKLKFIVDGLDSYYTSDNDLNIRFDGVKDVLRKDDIRIYSKFVSIPISNFDDSYYINYASKRDIQLWLKSIRQEVYEHFNLENLSENERKSYFIRYYIISEYGPTSRRGHFHGVLFIRKPEVAEFVLRVSMYKNWAMCNKALFDEHTHYCDSGAAQYVTNYLTVSDNLPTILKDKQIRPFRLASKNPSIGFSSFDASEIFESLFAGVNEYNKVISRCENNYIFSYPSEYLHRLLPKCREYSLVSYQRLRYVYGFLWRNVGKRKSSYEFCSLFLRKYLFYADGNQSESFAFSDEAQKKGYRLVHEPWFPQDITAAQKCFYFCQKYGYDVDTYLYLVDMYYYKEAMFALRKFYEWQELHYMDSVSIMFSYTNFQSYVKNERNNVRENTLAYFLYGFGLTLDALQPNSFKELVASFDENKMFKSEVENILVNMVKMPKFNEKFGFSPHNY